MINEMADRTGAKFGFSHVAFGAEPEDFSHPKSSSSARQRRESMGKHRKA